MLRRLGELGIGYSDLTGGSRVCYATGMAVIEAAAMFDFELRVAAPEGYRPPAGVAGPPAGAAAPAHAQGGGTFAGSPKEGGAQYGAPIVRARPARPVARYFRVGRCRDGWVMHCTLGDWTTLIAEQPAVLADAEKAGYAPQGMANPFTGARMSSYTRSWPVCPANSV